MEQHNQSFLGKTGGGEMFGGEGGGDTKALRRRPRTALDASRRGAVLCFKALKGDSDSGKLRLKAFQAGVQGERRLGGKNEQSTVRTGCLLVEGQSGVRTVSALGNSGGHEGGPS